MPMLQSVIRLKQIRRMQKLHELAHASSDLERSAHGLALAKEREAQARTTLWQSMTAEESLCVQRMTLARAEEALARKAREQAASSHDICARKRDALMESLRAIENEIEKLTERAEKERAASAQLRQKREWQAIDEFVVSRAGACQ